MAVDSTVAGSVIDSARARIAGTIRQAASATGASFEYLISAAKIESNLNPSAQASTSSARGLYQFIEQTWLGTVKEAGAAFGFGKYADAITRSPSGSYSVSDAATRNEILKLRDDPAANAAMAGVLTQSNSFRLTGELGRRPSDAELYMAHFMGVGGAARLINAAQDNPRTSAPGLFPAAAAANRSIFYNRDGSARSVSDVYSVLSSRYASAANSPLARTAIASAGGASQPLDSAAYLSGFPQVRTASVGGDQVAALQAPNAPMFRSLFQAGARSEPVSPAVRELWGNGASLTSDGSMSAQTNGNSARRPLDLFSDPNGIYSSG